MTTDNWPKPGKGHPALAVFHGTALRDQAALKAERATNRVPRVRLVTENGKTFYAISAHDLLDMDFPARDARPGTTY